jgi:hypothetical protein
MTVIQLSAARACVILGEEPAPEAVRAAREQAGALVHVTDGDCSLKVDHAHLQQSISAAIAQPALVGVSGSRFAAPLGCVRKQ